MLFRSRRVKSRLNEVHGTQVEKDAEMASMLSLELNAVVNGDPVERVAILLQRRLIFMAPVHRQIHNSY